MSFTDTPDFATPGQEKDTSVPRFYTETQRNNARSEADGVPRFDDVEMVEILIPGDRNSISVQLVNDGHRRRWPGAYRAFKDNSEAPADGTPITELPGMTRSQAEELAFQHVRTIETLAALSDDQATKAVSMGGFALRDRAKRYLDATAGDAAAEKLAAENREKDAKIEALQSQMADLMKRIEAMPQTATPTVQG